MPHQWPWNLPISIMVRNLDISVQRCRATCTVRIEVLMSIGTKEFPRHAESILMSKILISLIASFFFQNTSYSAGVSESNGALYPHEIISNTQLPSKQSRRITIYVKNSAISKDQCKSLITNYMNQAKPNGQVSVHKPSPLLNKTMQPWCVYNFDDKGVIFNDVLFDSK